MPNPKVIIKAKRDKPIRNQHPWIFSGAIDKAQDANPGDIVTVVDSGNNFLGKGYYNPSSQIRVRILTWQDEPIDDAWWQKSLQQALDGRQLQLQQVAEGKPIAFRLINAENDYIPGLVVDYYDGWLVLQALTLFIDQNKQHIGRKLMEMLNARGVYERSDVDVRKHEDLNSETGSLIGLPPPADIIFEHAAGFKLKVDIQTGHKTGFYLDQQENHVLFKQLVAANKETAKVLNCFAYTGAFTVAALATGNAEVVSVDSSREALEIAEENIALNDLSESQYDLIQANCFDYLRDAEQNNDQFDFVILDPPKFAHNKQQIEKASRGYKDLNLHAFRLVKPGGYLMTFSCSGAISRDLFQKIVFGALADSGRQAQIVRQLGASSDHPVALTFPEGDYLKGLLLRVL
ncbi:MAG: 23S rRNA (cytosine(1962)-C(5))-methyltransferase RlmI [Anaerolineaceae bacterium]|nr:23S rRNA (cytosine(1962)-C(5))-methyltransferase RlmI [Anaerolineaceae bacterium]